MANMAMPCTLLFRKPPEGLLEISDRVYVFNCCFNMRCADWSEERYKVYVNGTVDQFLENVPNASVMVCNFCKEETISKLSNIFSGHDIILTSYPPCHFHDCPVLEMEVISHFLRLCENWLSKGQNKVLLLHCEHGGWPVLAFMLAALLIFLKQYDGEQRTLDMVHRQAPHELLQLSMPLNPIPSQLRYLQYVSRGNMALGWPLLDRALRLDCIFLRSIPVFDGKGGCRPMFRIYGHDPSVIDKNPNVLYSMPKKTGNVRAYKQGDFEQVKIDINCNIKGDVLIESTNLNDDMESEQMMFQAMFNTNYIRRNMLMLSVDKIDTSWEAKDRFPKDFRIEILFSDMDDATTIIKTGSSCFEEEEGLPVEAFSKVQEIFSDADWMNPSENPTLNPFQQRHGPATDNGTHQHPISAEMLSEKNISSAKQCPNNDISKKGHETIKADATPLQLNRSDIICQEKPNTYERISESSICVTDSKNVNIKMYSSDIASSGYVDNSIGSISPQTSPLQLPLTRTPKKVQSSSPHMKSHPSHVFPLNSRHCVTNLTESCSPKRGRSFSPKMGSPFSHTIHDKSPTGAATHLSASEVTSTQQLNLSSSPSSPTPSLKILPQPKTSQSPLTHFLKEHEPIKGGVPPSPPTPPPKDEKNVRAGIPPPPTLLPCDFGKGTSPRIAPPPPPPPAAKHSFDHSNSSLYKSQGAPSVPAAPPPPTSDTGFPKSLSIVGGGNNVSGTEGHRSSSNGRILSNTMNSKNNTKKLKPLHWLKLSRAVQGSMWAEANKSSEASKAPKIDVSELERLFSAAVPSSDLSKKSKNQSSVGPKSDKVQLVEHTRAYNCEILLSKVKVPLQDLMSSVLALEESTLDTDQVENLIKFCPTKEEIEVIKGYDGKTEKLGRCEQFFLELMKVPRVESKFRVFSFKIRFHSQASDLRKNLNVVNAASEEIRNSVKLKRIMQTILSLGNALNQGTAKGSAIGFRLDSLLKLTETRARNRKITLMNYLCKVLADQLPEVLDFSNDLANLEPASKIQLKLLAEEMQIISKGLEKVEHELVNSENDGPTSKTFCKNLKEFLCSAEAEVCSMASLYSVVGRNVDALITYFGEDPSRCPFEQVVTTLFDFTGMFNKAHEENHKELELEMKKSEDDEQKKSEPKPILPAAVQIK